MPATAVARPERAWILSWTMVAVGLIGTALSVTLWGVRPTHLVATLGLVVAFTLADRFPVYYEFRESSVALSLTDAITTAGYFIVSPTELLVSRVLGGLLVSHVLDRTGPLKRVFNTGLVLLEALVSVGVFVAISAGGDLQAPLTWLAVVTAVSTSTAVDVVTLRLVMWFATGQRAGIDRWTALMMLLSSTLAGSTVLASLIMVDTSPAAPLLLLGPTLVLFLGHRAHVRTVQENRRIHSMYALASSLSRAPELDQVLVGVVTEARQTLRSAEAELLVLRPSDEPDLWIHIDRDGLLDTTTEDGWTAPPSHLRLLRSWNPGDGANGHVTSEEVAVPIASASELYGVLVVRGFRADRSAFDSDDLTVLSGVASQLAAHVSTSRLRNKLQTAEDAQRYLASHDVLTGLANRRRFEASLAQLETDPRAVAEGLSLLVMDLKRFRQLNDTLGPTAGDRVLVEVADRLRDSVSANALLARISSDEFVVAEIGGEPMQLAARLQDAVARPISVHGRELAMETAVGVACWPADVDRVPHLVRSADLALSVARARASSAVERYTGELQTTLTRRAMIGDLLPEAIRAGLIHLHYQPVVNLHTEQITMVEALARWTDPELGPVRPDEFVAVAEANGLIGDLTDLVLETAVAQAARWARAGSLLGVAVNISVHDLEREGLVGTIREVLVRHGLQADRLVLEITETAVMSDPARSHDVMVALRRLGVGLAIDDFGTGHSSLSYFRDLPATKLKVDRSFVHTLLDGEDDRRIVRAIVDLARGKDLVVVAEGIEDRETFDLLREMGVQYGQGFFMARPMPAADVDVLLTTGMHLPALRGLQG
ncbi:diguanylate cyclase/phosphodiesterase (GGDEF & EAL domains) with PAS/PAC sensor(s) [Euzebya pacifica]|uniref:Diguanylate cyclase/phosphodiesterase (GGDEF & EAL domains) with PAS/PAC sensor(S) n=1 Tax=Euzebya pacifica TaxID=1608957 RepID=A0A346Y3I4_9ACTN|nr:GGDEF domain-containing protein [Euzebya pacifica]AXV09031.1 diguanylate cyclase/phosphodiesterase (GGDEF & EAL domains) with PAS/PAC sensor(s) [Euzebya pacifica]